ncbi:MAG TPA: pilus assembly protein N-terminal domain-containing protein [Candidatus Binataceae bacterium]|nr:pilus assembly protein N-terminal domain-containing protein [Candidatus Binataceae bacterium]
MKPIRGCGILPWLAAALTLIMFRPGLTFAAADGGSQVSVSLNAGETYVIDNVAPGATPAVRVISNPHALVVHNDEPGKVVLLGTEAGEWAVKLKTASGETVYDVTVGAVANRGDINKAASAPAAISGSGMRTGAAAPVIAKADPGTGPVSSTGDAAALPPVTAGSAPDVSAPAMGAPSETAAAASAPAAAASASSTIAPITDISPAPAEKPADSSVVVSGASAPAAVPAGPATLGAAAEPINPIMPSQSAAANVTNKFRTDPSVALSGGDYPTTSVSGGTHPLPADTIDLMTGTSQIIDFPARIRRVSIADTNIADIQVVNPFQINLIGHKPGFTTLAVWNSQGRYDERQVRIDASGMQQVLLNCVVAELDRSNIENQGTNLSLALSNYGVSLFGMPGAVATPFSPQSTITTTLPNGTMISGGNASLGPAGSLIPMLLSQNMTYGIAAGNSAVQTQSFFQYLETHNLAKILAQPHLLANSGEEAKFLSGGEIPIVIAQALNTSIVFKQFGTSVQFVPTVVGRKNIELLVKPEVSQPDYAHGVSMFGFTIPAFVTRRAETMVRLQDNQTLIIAGLILHNPIAVVNKVPYLGDVPYLGGLFRTTSNTTQETDLVMSVTPQIVRPLPDGAQTYNPYDAGPMTAESIKTKALPTYDASRPRF